MGVAFETTKPGEVTFPLKFAVVPDNKPLTVAEVAVLVKVKLPIVTLVGKDKFTVPVVLLASIFEEPFIEVTPVLVIVILPVEPDVEIPVPALRPETPRVERDTHVGVEAPFDCNIEPLVPTAVNAVPVPV